MVDINDNTSVNIPIRNLIALIAVVAIDVTGYVNLTARIANLEGSQNMRDVEIKMNSEFRVKWPRGELGALPDDAEQNLRLTYLESEVLELSKSVHQLQIEGAKQ